MLITASVNIGEALLNTLMGMGTVFVVLIFISFVISLFSKLNKPEVKADKANSEEVTVSVDNAVVQIEETEELSDDMELVAVITAAIAAYQGTSTEGFQVRSIRRAHRNR